MLLVLVDSNPYLSSGSKQSLEVATRTAKDLGCKVTVAVIDDLNSSVDVKIRADTVAFWMAENDFSDYELSEIKTANLPTLVVSDLCEETDFQIAVVSTDAVSQKLVDANLLSEFILCPLLLVPDA
ncbi:hypothetical protein CYMTET_53302 [Cymbomonas tetramitiformis]|uniref:Universal stress protein n=1 Tax=Cymbomonas tetramitiformis TaxID=36881 RepID=A0AAE0ERV5_9CHLO|nr:hypothetical protein CYMTET_53302 [Cymbomonas tetramitiformis]